jgi:hypothetical protein
VNRCGARPPACGLDWDRLLASMTAAIPVLAALQQQSWQ